MQDWLFSNHQAFLMTKVYTDYLTTLKNVFLKTVVVIPLINVQNHYFLIELFFHKLQ
jgi:hypothetical protein